MQYVVCTLGVRIFSALRHRSIHRTRVIVFYTFTRAVVTIVLYESYFGRRRRTVDGTSKSFFCWKTRGKLLFYSRCRSSTLLQATGIPARRTRDVDNISTGQNREQTVVVVKTTSTLYRLYKPSGPSRPFCFLKTRRGSKCLFYSDNGSPPRRRPVRTANRVRELFCYFPQ